MKIQTFIITVLILISGPAWAQHEEHKDHGGHAGHGLTDADGFYRRPMGPADCSGMMIWDYMMGMCMPRAMKGMPMRMLMVQGNAFAVQNFAEDAKGRGRNAFGAPNMFMIDIGSSVGDRHYVNLDIMGTAERWTFPKAGYPELLQIGEENADHEAYIDAQHPHSSPIMGLTLSDTISIGDGKDYLKFWFAPRGQASEGPVAFMHRPTGMVNPDVPLGHHIGQDVAHISGTVLGGLVHLGESTLEVSAFNGTEPQPAKVDLPIDKLNSFAARATYQFTPHFYAMTSAARVDHPEPHDPLLDHIWRYSASAYFDRHLESGWMFHNTFIYGLVNGYDDAAALNSFGDEFWIHKDARHFWGRVEHLQRTAGQLEITSATPNSPSWVTALTLGYTHKCWRGSSAEIGVGASVTKDFLPSNFRTAYGGDPVSGRVFVQVNGMKMWDY